MVNRLNTQRVPSKAHARPNYRTYQRGYDVIPTPTWGETGSPSLSKGAAKPGDVFPPEATVTAEDSTNAAKLAGLGYVASPTSNWTVGQAITIGAYRFNWTGAAWAAGAHA